VGDLDNQAQVRPDHQGTRGLVAFLNLGGEFDLLLRREERDLTNLAKVNLDSRVGIFAGFVVHIWVWRLRFSAISMRTASELGCVEMVLIGCQMVDALCL
jgi:hypothetical protein